MTAPIFVPPRLRVGVDVTAGVNQLAGIGRVTRETVAALAALGPPLELRLFYSREQSSWAREHEAWLRDLAAGHSHVSCRRLPVPPRLVTRLWLRQRLPFPAELLTGPIDVLLAPDFIAPPTVRARTLVTVHDLSYLIVPEYAEPRLRAYLTEHVPPALHRAAHVIAVSETTRRALIEHLGLPEERVSVVYNGVDPRFAPLAPDKLASVSARLRLPERFVLAHGTIEPRKNYLGLLRAFAQIAADYPDLHLVISGKRGWLDEPIFAEVDRLGLGSRVRFLGPVADHDLPALYGLAAVFAYPSWYEGFGLPPLEAMACGTPVVASTGGALPEVCADAALLVDPGDVDCLSASLRRVLSEPALRQRLRERGLAQARTFTWSRSARRLVEIMKRVKQP